MTDAWTALLANSGITEGDAWDHLQNQINWEEVDTLLFGSSVAVCTEVNPVAAIDTVTTSNVNTVQTTATTDTLYTANAQSYSLTCKV